MGLAAGHRPDQDEHLHRAEVSIRRHAPGGQRRFGFHQGKTPIARTTRSARKASLLPRQIRQGRSAKPESRPVHYRPGRRCAGAVGRRRAFAGIEPVRFPGEKNRAGQSLRGVLLSLGLRGGGDQPVVDRGAALDARGDRAVLGQRTRESQAGDHAVLRNPRRGADRLAAQTSAKPVWRIPAATGPPSAGPIKMCSTCSTPRNTTVPTLPATSPSPATAPATKR